MFASAGAARFLRRVGFSLRTVSVLIQNQANHDYYAWLAREMGDIEPWSEWARRERGWSK